MGIFNQLDLLLRETEYPLVPLPPQRVIDGKLVSCNVKVVVQLTHHSRVEAYKIPLSDSPRDDSIVEAEMCKEVRQLVFVLRDKNQLFNKDFTLEHLLVSIRERMG